MRPAAFLRLALLAALAVVAWMWRDSMDAEPAADLPAGPEVAGYYLFDALLVSPGDDGRPLYRLTAKRMTHPVDGELITLTGVRLEYALDSPRPWVLEADRGEVNLGWRTVLLEGNVELVSEPGEGQVTRVEAPEMLVETEAHQARSAGEVTLTLGSETVSGTGMVADLMAGQVQLQSRVHGRFLP